MSEPEERTYQEYKDDQLRGPEPSEPPDGPELDLDRVEAAHAAFLRGPEYDGDQAASFLLDAVPELLARLRAAEEELADWQGRERRTEYGLASKSPAIRVLQVSQEVAERAWANPKVGPPLERTVTTSEWSEMVLPPF